MRGKKLGLSTSVLWSISVFIFLVTLCQAQLLCNTRGWFGDNCQYMCHCANVSKCDFNTGECKDNSACAKGWFGPSCQYVDLTTTMTNKTGWLYDGDDTTCNEGQQSVTVQLNESVPLTWLRLYVKNAADLDNLNVQFLTTSSTLVPWDNKKTAAVNDKTLDLNCDLDETVQKVRITGEGVGSLCSVYISGGRNIALKQPTAMSSKFNPNTLSPNAVDGNRDGNWHHESCTQTQVGDADPSWSVKFGHPQIINRYVLYNRNDAVPGRLLYFNLTSYTADSTQVFTYQDQKTEPQDVYTVIPGVTSTSPVNNVTIRATHKLTGVDSTPVLTLCEVETYGDTICPPGRYGRECEHSCTNCVNDTCWVSTGACLNGCNAGYTGYTCQTTCPDTYYGQDCKQECSTNCVDQLCNSVNGTCNQCPPGKKGDLCDQDCPNPTYGQDCQLTCSTNCVDQKCNSVSGVCDQCPLGKMGEQCNQDCDDEKYGNRCQETCSEHCVSQNPDARSCDIANGTCVLGCVDGYRWPLCLASVAGDDGGSSSFPIGPVAGGIAGALLIAVIIVGFVLWRRRRSKNDPLIAANRGSKAKVSESDSGSSHEMNGISNPYNTMETENSTQPLTAVVTSGSTAPKPTIKPKPTVKPKKSAKAKDTSSAAEKPGKPGDYYNAVGAASTTSISVKDLDNFLKSHDKEFFRKQFSEIPSNNDAKTTVGQSHENKAKNRYKNICAYDHSRVLLQINKEKKQGDYINACHIKGYKEQEKFIASQGATKLMMEDFVRMLWEQRTEKVVMLTNLVEEGKMKCEQYWPEDNDVQMGDIKVTLATTDVCADYTIRRLQLSKEGEGTHLLTQFHFTSWPDKGVPTTPWGLVDFEQRVAWDPTDKPIVVHCSAGVGRTGTFIALRNVMREAEDTGSIDFFTTVKNLRHDRINMVQTAEQYEFLHHAAQVAIICMDTTVTSSDIQERINKLKETSSSGQTHLEKEFNSICLFCAEDDDAVTDTQSDEKSAKNKAYENSEAVLVKAKDRLKNVPAKESYRAILNWENEYMGEYINAVLCPSFTKQNQRILTQLPLPTTVRDFWLMVTQYKVSMVVAFELDLRATDSTIGTYLPAEQDEGLTIPLFKITTSPVTPGEVGDVQTVTVTTDGLKKQKNSSDFKAEEHKVVHITCKKTKLEPSSMLALVKQIRSMRGGDGCIVYMCRNGATCSGLLCVLTLLLDRLDHDLRLTVPLVVGTIKSIRPQVIPTLDQYKLLYQALHMYNESNNVYSNFGDSKPGDGAENNSTQGSGDDDKEKGTIYANA